MNKFLVSISVAFFSAISFDAIAMPAKFFEVSPGIYRSAQPSKTDMADLKEFGIKTILNLNNDDETMAKEQKAAKKLGIEVIEHPMSGFWSPDELQVEESLKVLQDPNNHPILIHCKHGEDRTGLIVGLHRVYAEGWTPDVAYEEMLERGFHPILYYLDRYFKIVTGLSE